jgi:hypothetical protein
MGHPAISTRPERREAIVSELLEEKQPVVQANVNIAATPAAAMTWSAVPPLHAGPPPLPDIIFTEPPRPLRYR